MDEDEYDTEIDFVFTSGATAKITNPSGPQRFTAPGTAPMPMLNDLVELVYVPGVEFICVGRKFFLGPNGQRLQIALGMPGEDLLADG